jgi:hypothetical protein
VLLNADLYMFSADGVGDEDLEGACHVRFVFAFQNARLRGAQRSANVQSSLTLTKGFSSSLYVIFPNSYIYLYLMSIFNFVEPVDPPTLSILSSIYFILLILNPIYSPLWRTICKRVNILYLQ